MLIAFIAYHFNLIFIKSKFFIQKILINLYNKDRFKGVNFMGLTFKRQDDLEKMMDKFAVMPEDLKTTGKGKGKDKDKDEKQAKPSKPAQK